MATVANTAANISGDTLLTAENTDVITGQKTFDRDPSAPFAVSSGSALVTNLDADKHDGMHAAEWASYAPTNSNLTTGNGTLSGAFFRMGQTVHYRVVFVFGGTSAVTGQIEFGLPTAMELTATAMPIGYGTIFDSSTGDRYMIVLVQGASNVLAQAWNVASPLTATNATVPITFATSDQIIITGTYKAAAAL